MDGLMAPEGVGGGRAQYPAGALTGRGRREGVSWGGGVGGGERGEFQADGNPRLTKIFVKYNLIF